jgi:hypothetical protein
LSGFILRLNNLGFSALPTPIQVFGCNMPKDSGLTKNATNAMSKVGTHHDNRALHGSILDRITEDEKTWSFASVLMPYADLV